MRSFIMTFKVKTRANISTVLRETDRRIDDALGSIQAIDDSDTADLFHPIDGALCGIYHTLKNCQRYAVIHGQPTQQPFDPAQTLRRYSGSRPYSNHTQCVSVEGDQRIVATILQLLQENFELSVGGRLSMHLYIDEPIRYIFNFAEESALHDTLSAGKSFTIPMPTIHDSWEGATDGGYMELSATNLALFFQGDAPKMNEGDALMDATSHALASGVQRLRSWRSPSGAYEGPFAATPDAKRLYTGAATTAKQGIAKALTALG